MGVLLIIIGVAAAVFILGWLAEGLGVMLGLVSLVTHPVGGRKPRRTRVKAQDEYYRSHPTLSNYDARYQSRENKPSRGPQDV